jgi:hypothetical protein
MVELIHCYRPSSNYDGTREEWADSIQKNGIRPKNEELNGSKPEIHLYHPEHPPDESLTDYTCVSVEIGKDELSVRSCGLLTILAVREIMKIGILKKKSELNLSQKPLLNLIISMVLMRI